MDMPSPFFYLRHFHKPQLALPGIIVLQTNTFTNYEEAGEEMLELSQTLQSHPAAISSVAMIIICNDADFTAKTLNNFIWVTFTRCNPSHDIYGVASSYQNKHWGCRGPLIIDARSKPHHAPPVEKDAAVESRVNRLFEKGGSLYKVTGQ